MSRSGALLLPLLAGLLGACQPAVPEGRFGCTTAAECPEGWYCRADRTCWSTPGQSDAGAPDAGADAGAMDAGARDAGARDAGPRDAGAPDAGPRDSGPPDAGPECVTPADCDDGVYCNGAEDCVDFECVSGAPVTCAGDLVCLEAMGRCGCASGVRCDTSCYPTCCPGAMGGSCGRCGTSVCSTTGTGWACTGEHGNCDPGYSCTADACDDPCPAGTRRECFDCVLSGCF